MLTQCGDTGLDLKTRKVESSQKCITMSVTFFIDFREVFLYKISVK